MNVTDTISLLEIMWTIPALLAFGYVVWMAWDVFQDALNVIRHRWNGAARTQVMGQLRTEILTLCSKLAIVLMGILAMSQANTTADAIEITATSWAITWLFLMIPTLATIRAIGSRMDRERVRSLDRQERAVAHLQHRRKDDLRGEP